MVFLKIKGTSASSSMSMTTKSTRNKNLSTFTIKSSTIPYEYFIDLSASYRVIFVGLTSTSPIFLSMGRGIRLMLAPRSINALLIVRFPMVTGKVKLSGSPDFCGKDFFNDGTAPSFQFNCFLIRNSSLLCQ